MPSPPAMAARRRFPAGILTSAILLLSLLSSSSAADRSTDRTALFQFKNSVADPASLLAAWSASTDACSWPGVACDARSRVVAVNVSAPGTPSPSCPRSGSFRRPCPDPGGRLAGRLSPALSALSELRILSLPFHALTGEIPAEFSLLEQLEVLDLEGNSLSGGLPLKFPAGLRVLRLASNQLEGPISASLSSSVGLQTLDLSGNRLNGTIPSFFGDLPNLGELLLSFNQLVGSIPGAIGSHCQSLEQLDLAGNLLTGSIPHNLGNCGELQSLLLFSNLLEDVIPLDLGRLTKLRVLDVSRNSLSGPVPAELGGCVKLSVLVISNPFDPVPSLDDSSYGVDDYNYFEGGISENITALPELRVLWAPKANVEGEIPSNWGACQSLEMLNLGHNLLIGGIPKVFGQCKNLKFLNLSSNRLTNWLSEELPVPCMDVFDVSGNMLSGSIPKFIHKTCLPSLPLEDISSAYYSYFASRIYAEVSSSLFEFGVGSAIYHNFAGNNFTGALPSLPLAPDRFQDQTSYVFLAYGNHLVGPLTGTLFDKCNELNGLVMNFSSNMISGEIPAGIGDMCKPLLAFDVSANEVTGMIPESFSSAERLVSLDLSWNKLHGQIPASLGKVKSMEYLLLAANSLNGKIPVEIGQLQSLKVLDLSFNALSGAIPGGLVNLKNLTTILLVNNKLSGKIPSEFGSVASLSMFNVSFNNLSGPLPSKAGTISCESVIGNPLFPCKHMLSLSTPPLYPQGKNAPETYSDSSPEGSPTQSSSSGFSSIEIASITSASAIVSVLLALVVLYLYTRKCASRSKAESSGRREVTIFTDIGVPITYEAVVRSTGSFNASNCIGSGGFGATYKAEISPGVIVAIKRLSVGRIQGDQQFHAEIKTLGRWRHPNLVTLIGYHMSEGEMFLIYNYLPGGNLERFIQERFKRPIDWRMLHKIALDVARALAYLHDHCVPRILHRDVKPSNILLDNDFNAYLSDFGLARLLGNSETHATTGVAGTFGYVAPEYAMTCRVSDKADVYSYGVVLLELISDKKALDPSFSPYGNGFNIVAYACMLLRQGRAREFFTDGLWDVGPHDDLVETLHLAVMCTVDSLSIRPTMKQVVQRLKQLQPPTC